MEVKIYKGSDGTKGSSLCATLKDMKPGDTLAVDTRRIDYVRNRISLLNGLMRARGDVRYRYIASYSGDMKAVLVHRLSGDERSFVARRKMRLIEMGNCFEYESEE